MDALHARTTTLKQLEIQGLRIFLRRASIVACAVSVFLRTIHAATAARMNTYAGHASNRNLTTKLHHADKLCLLHGNLSLARWKISPCRHSRFRENDDQETTDAAREQVLPVKK
ncbi:hypothetical protein [Dyella acidisoli]|uniref:hypothetical protein n=1 Tax=Dyella acidisoli TaxID=1867834 RepID=UPI0024E0DEE0|nr:hypothetical protein [Dyella acidisoli]